MSKKYKYTIVTLSLAVIFSLGSMAGMKLTLQIRERQLLTESGRASMKTPVRSWQTADSKGGEDEKVPDEERHMLTTEKKEKVLDGWNNRTGVTIHNPVNGQFSMEEAIVIAKEWLAQMGLREDQQEGEIDVAYMRAQLGVATQETLKGEQLEPYYSIWTVYIVNDSLQGNLYINAVTGEVWGAEIYLDNYIPVKRPYVKLRRFAVLSGLDTKGAALTIYREGTRAILEMDDSRIYAEMEFYCSGTIASSKYDVSPKYNEAETVYKGNTRFVFKLLLKENWG